MIKRLPILVVLMCICTNMYAQFYDSDDEVRIYVLNEDYPQPIGSVSCVFLNFNGEKGAVLAEKHVAQALTTGNKKGLAHLYNIFEDSNYLEKLIYGKEIVIIYFNAETSQNQYCYEHVFKGYGPFGSYSYKTKYIFSKDGNTLTRISSNGYKEDFTRISKDELIKLFLLEKNGNQKKWR